MKIIGIHGRARSGKDTLASFLVNHHHFGRVALADPLREFIADITGLEYHELLDGPAKEEPIAWLGGKSPRQMMQTLGTEWGRELVDEGIWLHVCARRIDRFKREGFVGVVVPDIRFDNEAEFIRSKGGVVVEVRRDGAAAVSAHASEAGVSGHLIDYRVHNNGTLLDLARHAETLAL